MGVLHLARRGCCFGQCRLIEVECEDLVDTCWGLPGSSLVKATLVCVQVCGEKTGLGSDEAAPVGEMAASADEVVSLTLSGHKGLPGEVAAVDSESQQYFGSSLQLGPEEPGHAVEERLEEQQHPIVDPEALPHRFGMPEGEHLVALEHCAG